MPKAISAQPFTNLQAKFFAPRYIAPPAKLTRPPTLVINTILPFFLARIAGKKARVR